MSDHVETQPADDEQLERSITGRLLFFSVLGDVPASRRTPWVAIVFTAALVCLLLVAADVDRLATVTVLFLIVVHGVVLYFVNNAVMDGQAPPIDDESPTT